MYHRKQTFSSLDNVLVRTLLGDFACVTIATPALPCFHSPHECAVHTQGFFTNSQISVYQRVRLNLFILIENVALWIRDNVINQHQCTLPHILCTYPTSNWRAYLFVVHKVSGFFPPPFFISQTERNVTLKFKHQVIHEPQSGAR